MKVPSNLSDHLQELFGFLGFFPSPRGTPPRGLSNSASAYFTQLSGKEEPELRTRRRTLLFVFPFWKLQHPVQPQPPTRCSSGCHGTQTLPMKPAFGPGSTEPWTGAASFFFLNHDDIFQRLPNEVQAY